MKNRIASRVLASLRGITMTAVLLLGTGAASAQVTETFTSGTSWTVPAGVTSITVECWGGGGGGGASTSNASANPGNQFTSAGGGGKGGMYTSTTLSVTSGTVYTVVVGAGGAGGNLSAGGAGGKSSLTLSGSDVIWASGGNGGGYGNNSSGAAATGYATAGPTGVTLFDGGNGAAGQKTTTRQSGGGGGGGAGSSANGTSATNPTSGGGSPTGVSAGGAGGATGGGNGGAGGSGTSANTANAGTAGSTFGGAGGGARSTTTTSGNKTANGGAGAAGQVKITYTVNICTADAGSALSYICENGTSAALGGTVGGLSTTGIWSDGGAGGTFSPAATDLNATWTAPAGFTGTATLTLTTTDGSCATSGTASKTIIVANAPAAPVFTSGATAICEGGTSTYTATSAGVSATVTYSILSGGASIDASTGAVSNVTADFTVRATATNNCGTSTTDFAVTVNPNPAVPTISASGATTFCQDDEVTLTSSQASGNVWSNSASTASIAVGQAGSYTVTYTDGNGCSATSAATTVTVNPNPVPTITASGATVFCEGGSVTLTSSGNSGNVWSTSEATNSITVDESGDYTVTYTDANGCFGTSTVTAVTVNPNPTPAITAGGATTFCEGGSVTITSSASSGNLWSTGETGNSITVDESDVISVTVTDANGCSGISNEITTNETTSFTPVITASGPTTFCQGGSVTITSSETSGNLWSTGEQSNSITVNQTTSVTLTNSASCATGTSNEILVTVNANPAVPTITANGPLTFCAGGNVVLTSSAVSGNVWSNTTAANSITVTQSGNYTVTVTNGNNCSATSAPQTVTVNAVPTATATLSNAITITATPAGQTYQWINCANNQPVSGATSATFTATANGSYKVIVTNAAGCKDTSGCVQVSKVGIDDLEANTGISLYPNPTHGKITITSDFAENVQVVVFDASGKILIEQKILSGEIVDLSTYKAGIYLFKVQTEKGLSLHRIVLE